MQVIAFSGKVGAGKTWCSKYIMQMDIDTAIASFAGSLKYEMMANGVRASTVRTKPWSDLLRRYAQAHGDMMRSQNQRHYIDPLMAQLDAHQFSGHRLILIDDLRYMNEMQALRDSKFNVTFVRLVKTNTHYLHPKDLHWSETTLDSYGRWDRYIKAKDGDLALLEAEMEALVKEVMEK